MADRHPLRMAIPSQRRPHASERGHVQRRPQRVEQLDDLAKIRDELLEVEGRLHVQAVVAREAGATWAEIGRVLGMTTKCAWKRYAALV